MTAIAAGPMVAAPATAAPARSAASATSWRGVAYPEGDIFRRVIGYSLIL